MRYRSNVGRDAKGNTQGWLLPTVDVAVQAAELQDCSGRGGIGGSSGSSRRSNGWIPASWEQGLPAARGKKGTRRMTRILKLPWTSLTGNKWPGQRSGEANFNWHLNNDLRVNQFSCRNLNYASFIYLFWQEKAPAFSLKTAFEIQQQEQTLL